MASVELRPGDTLNIVWSSVQNTPLGCSEVESSFAFSYEELLTKLRAKGRLGKSKKSGTVGARFSRFVSLSTNALKKGKWATGAHINRDIVFNKLIEKLQSLDASEYRNVTTNARLSLASILDNHEALKKSQQDRLKVALKKLNIPEENEAKRYNSE